MIMLNWCTLFWVFVSVFSVTLNAVMFWRLRLTEKELDELAFYILLEKCVENEPTD